MTLVHPDTSQVIPKMIVAMTPEEIEVLQMGLELLGHVGWGELCDKVSLITDEVIRIGAKEVLIVAYPNADKG